MLAFLDSLCAALLARNAIEIFRLLGLPDAHALPRVVREEAVAIAKAGAGSFMAPVQTLHLYYKYSHLVDENSDLLYDRRHEHAPAFDNQMELPFRRIKVG